MDYKKKYLKYKLKYLTAKKLYGGMDAKTLTQRVDKIVTDLPEYYGEKWKQDTEKNLGIYNSTEKLKRMIKGYRTSSDRTERYYYKNYRLRFYKDYDMIGKIARIKKIQTELEDILKHWEDIAAHYQKEKEEKNTHKKNLINTKKMSFEERAEPGRDESCGPRSITTEMSPEEQKAFLNYKYIKPL